MAAPTMAPTSLPVGLWGALEEEVDEEGGVVRSGVPGRGLRVSYSERMERQLPPVCWAAMMLNKPTPYAMLFMKILNEE